VIVRETEMARETEIVREIYKMKMVGDGDKQRKIDI
jgi:hypothetical protein